MPLGAQVFEGVFMEIGPMVKSVGCVVALFLFLVIVFGVACLPALPFWLGGHTIWGGLAYVLVGLPIGIVTALAIIMILGNTDDDDNDDNDDDTKKPMGGGANRIKNYFEPSAN